MLRIRRATIADLTEVIPRTQRFNVDEGIEIDEARLEAATRRLLEDGSLGRVWLIEDAAVIGHAVVTFGYDLEWGGRDSFLTELWIDPPARGRGAATVALAQIAAELRAADIQALHLQVRPDNPARRLYERAGFTESPRVTMSRRLG